MNPIVVSVVMPVHNGERFLAAALQSILTQQVDLEVLVHDDGSTDATAGILADAALREPRVRVSRAANAGPANARNVCLPKMRGSLVAFMDHDDLWPAGRLERQVDLLARTPSADGVLGHTMLFDELDANGHPADTPVRRVEMAGLLQAGLFRARAVDAVGGFDAQLRAADDFDFLLRMIEHGARLTIDPDVAVFYRQHPGQWTKDLAKTGLQTARALRKSLDRRRQGNAIAPFNWRLQDDPADV
jgi:glycosyltransferase involved in cell wall biosynthesis